MCPRHQPVSARFLQILSLTLTLLALWTVHGAPASAQNPSQVPSDTTRPPSLNESPSVFSLPPEALQGTRNRFIHEFTVGARLRQPLDERPLDRRLGARQQGEFRASPTAEFWLRYVPVENWFAQVGFIGYLQGDQAPWDPEFTYVFGYDNWRPYTFSLTYSNYEGNKFSPGTGESFTQIEQGTLELGWKAPNPLREWLRIHPSSDLQHRISLLTSPEYVNTSGETQNWKTRLALASKYNVYQWWYVEFTAFVYPKPSQQQPWDPDFTYGFGYSDWHPGTFSIQYNNYSGTRWLWRSSPSGTGRFLDGSISASWSYTF